MKLKTLKDLQRKGNEEDFVNCSVVSTKSLRQEAIQWIKHYKIVFLDGSNSLETEKQRLINKNYEAKVEWIKTFFNIPESDLLSERPKVQK